MLRETVQALLSLSQTIARESGDANISNEMKSSLDQCFEKLRQIEELFPLVLNRNKTFLVHLQKFDEQSIHCTQWFNEGRQLINRYSIQVPLRRIEEFLEQNRVRYFYFHQTNIESYRFNCYSRDF